MNLTETELFRIYPNARPTAGVFVPALNAAMAHWGLTDRLLHAYDTGRSRQAA